MRRFVVASLAATISVVAGAQSLWPQNSDGTPSVTDPSIPLSYVGNDASVSIGVNAEGHTEGQLMGVFARDNTRATVAQLWWDRSGAGGMQTDFNWLWGMDALAAREHPDEVTVARLSFALDQNEDHDRKATLGFGIERREFSLEAYLSGGISGARRSDPTLANTEATIHGTDTIGDYTEVETTSTETIFDRQPYGAEIGVQASHFFESTATRLHGGVGYQDGKGGAHSNTLSVGVDTQLGVRGWGLSGLAEHVSKRGSLDNNMDDDRVAVFLRYEFGAHGSFVPSNQLEDPAWISRSLARPSSAHPRVVESYRTKKKENVSVTRSPKQYTNRFPIAQNDTATVTAGTAVTIAVLANDTDPDGDPLALTAVAPPAHGTASIAGSTIVYAPAPGFSGTDTFAYTVGDGHGGSANANVSVTVGAAPNSPPAAVPDNANTTYGQPVSIDVLDNDSDPDGNTLTIANVTQPSAGGTVTISGGRVVFTPALGFSGVVRFTYTIDDGRGGTSTAQVTVVVSAAPNRAPIAVNDAATTAFGTPVTVDVLANDADPDGDTLSISAVTLPANGAVVISGRSIVYTPAAGYSGPDAFGYTVSDGRGGTASATVAITVTPQPNRPPVAVDDAATTLIGTPVNVNVLANDSDPDGDPLTISGVTTPANGSVIASGGTITYTPALRFTGVDRFTYTIDDGRGGSATANVTITVNAAPNQPPIAVNDAVTTPSGQPVTINALANDSDPDGDPLTIVSIGTPTLGTATIANNMVVYTPAAGISGIDQFTYTIDDGRGGTASATITVTIAPPANRPPIAVNDTAQTPVSTAVTIDVLANDSDPDGDPLTIFATTAPTNGGSVQIVNGQILYTPFRGFTGTDTFTYTISDGRGGTATATVTVTVV